MRNSFASDQKSYGFHDEKYKYAEKNSFPDEKTIN